MGFMDELKKLTQPYDDEDDFFEGADESFKPTPVQTEPPAQVSAEQAAFESSFAAPAQNASSQAPKKPVQAPRSFFGTRGQAQQPQPLGQADSASEQPESLFGSFGKSRAPKAQSRGAFGGSKESQVILFAPKTFDEAGEIVGHINASHSIVMTLEGLPMDTARRLLDFISGIAFALQGKITPISAKTYFVAPRNVDIVGVQNEQPESDGQYF